MDYVRLVLKESLKITENSKCNFSFADDLALEYYKWISYILPFELNHIEALMAKNVDVLTEKELLLIKKYKEDKCLAERFKRYISGDCLKKDVLPIYDYMHSHSIEIIINSKLSKREKMKANTIIERYKNLPLDELADFVSKRLERERFLEMSMIEAYVVRELNKILGFESDLKFERDLNVDLEENSFMLVKSYDNANRPLM